MLIYNSKGSGIGFLAYMMLIPAGICIWQAISNIEGRVAFSVLAFIFLSGVAGCIFTSIKTNKEEQKRIKEEWIKEEICSGRFWKAR